MIDPDVSRLSRLVALHTLLQTKRTVTATELAARFSVSTRTIYRDIRTLESAGMPIVTSEHPNTYQQLIIAVSAHRLVRISYLAADTGELTIRDIEPIGLYLSQHWHVVAYCRLRLGYRNFRLNRISSLALSEEFFSPRPETLQQYWADEAKRRDKEKVVIQFDPSAVLPAQVQHLHDTKHQYGWAHEHFLPDGSLDMLFFVGSLPYLATWLLPFAGAIRVVEPAALQEHLSQLAEQAYDSFHVKRVS